MADSIQVLVIAAALFFFGIVYVFFTSLIGTPATFINDGIGTGAVTQGTADAFSNVYSLWEVSPFMVLLALILFSYERSKGTMIPAQVYFQYLVLMVLGNLISLLVLFGIGTVHDTIISAVSNISTDIGVWGDIAEDWGSTSIQYYMSRVMYLVLMLPAYLCSILFVFHPVIMQTDVSMAFGGLDDSEYSDSNLKQF